MVPERAEEDGVRVLTLKNPPVNALSTRLLQRLGERIGAIERDASVRAVVLQGDGQYFSAGADLKEMASMDLADAPKVVRAGHALFGRLEALGPPVIASISGLAVGGGLELALACDLRVAGDSAKLGAPEVNYGLMPAYGGTQRLPRTVGRAKAKELIFTGTMIAAAEALRIGLVNKVVPSGQESRAARDLAHTIALKAPKAVQAAKRAIREGFESPLAQGLELEAKEFETNVLSSEDLGEGLQSFLERRPPKFQGK
jgi:enoyl-CoA hydratase/carnithine racemase